MPGGKYRNPTSPPKETYYEPEIRETTWKDIYNQAVRKDMWIYEPARKQWFSPQEFKNFYERYHMGFGKMFDQCKVMDPLEGLKAADKMIIDLQEKRAELLGRILADYKIKK